MNSQIVTSQQHISQLAGSKCGLYFAAASKISTADRYRIYLLSYPTLQTLSIIAGHEKPILSLTFTSNSRILISSSCDSYIKLWPILPTQISTSSVIWQIHFPDYHFQSIATDLSWQYMACGDQQGRICVWNMLQKTMTMRWQGLSGCVSCIQIIESDQQIHYLVIGGSTRKNCICSIEGQNSTQEIQGQINIWKWGTLEKVYSFDQNGSSNFHFEVFEHWILLADDSQAMTFNCWPDISQFQVSLNSLDHQVPVGELHQIQGVQWFSSGQSYLIFTKLGTVVQYNFEKANKGSQTNVEAPVDKREDTLTKTFSKISSLLKKSGRLGDYGTIKNKLSITQKWKMEFQKQINDAKYSVEQDYLLLAFDDHTLLNYDIKYKDSPFKKVGTEGQAFCIRFSPNNTLIAVGDSSGFLIIIDRFTLTIISKTQPHEGCIDFIEFFPNGERMVTKSKDLTFKIWKLLPNLQEIISIDHDSDTNLSISSDGNWLVVGNNDGSLIIHETNQWASMNLQSYQIEITAVCFAKNSDMIISANLEKIIILTDNKQKEIIKKFEGHADPIIALASSPDGKQFASGGWDFVIKLWSIAKKILIGNLVGHKDCVNQLKYSPDGNVLFSCSNDRTIKLWSVQRMEIIINLNIEDFQIQQFDVIYEEKIICFVQEDQVVLLYGKEQNVKFHSQWNEEVGTICYTSQKNLVASSIGPTISLMNVNLESQLIRDKSASQSEMIQNQEMRCNSIVKRLTFSQGRIYATCQDGQIYVFSLNNFQIIHTFQDQECVQSLKNNRLIITAEEQQINIWDGINFELQSTLPQIWVNKIAISESGQRIACSNQKMQCIIWDLENFQEITAFSLHQKQIYDIKFGQDDKVVGSAGEDKIIYIWQSSGGMGPIKQLKGHTDTINCFCFMNNDLFILSGGEQGVLKYWKISTEEQVHNLALHSMPIKEIICYEKSSYFAYCFGSNVIVANFQRDILNDIQIQETDCRPLMASQNFQLLSPNGILSRYLGTVFRPQIKNQFILDDELKHSASFLTEQSLQGSQIFNKIRQQLLNPKERQHLLDYLSNSEFLFQTFDDDLAYAMFNGIYESLKEVRYDNMQTFVQNMFYSVLNCQTSQGKRTLQEMLRQQKFSQHLSVKELQYLLSLSKFLKQHIQTLHNASKYRVWHDKIRDIKQLNLQKNSYLSSLLCKSQLLMNMDKTFQTFKLLTPQEIMQNEHFNIFKSEDYQPKCFNVSRSKKIEKQVSQIGDLRDKIALFNFDEFDNYIQDFIFELILELEGLDSIDLSYLNLTDEFCEDFCNTFINREYCPDLQIFSNERISHVGQKYLQVLFTKHKSSKLNLHSLNQRKCVQANLDSKIKLLESENYRKRFNPEQIELLKFDMNELKQSLDDQLSQLKQQDDFLSIQEYFERQSETVKRSQILLNFGILGYLNELIFTKNTTVYCSYCNKYVCIQCHQQKHETQKPCVLCFKCFKFHQGFEDVLDCRSPDNFYLQRERQSLYQDFKFSQNQVCLYGGLKTLDRIDDSRNSFSLTLAFKLKCRLFSLIQWVEQKILNIQIFIMFQLARIVKSKAQSQEDLKAGLFEQLQVLAVDQYNFNNNVFDLEEQIEKPKYLVFTIILFILWYVFSLSLPILFPGEQTVKWEAHFIFLGYLTAVFIIELQVIRSMTAIVNKPVEGEVKLIRDLSPLKYFTLLFTTAFAKYDFYTDVIFATVLYRQQDIREVHTLYILSLIFIIVPSTISLLQSSLIIWGEIWYRLHRKNNQKTLRCINFYSRISILLEHESIGWLLDKFASNTAIKIGRTYVPQKIISSFFKVAFENMPQLVIQLIYQLKLQKDSNLTLIITTLTTIVSLVMQVFVFLMAKSSFVNEIDQSKMSQRLGLSLARKQTEEEKEQLKMFLFQKESKSSRSTTQKNFTRTRISRVSEEQKKDENINNNMEIELTTNRNQEKDSIIQI